MVGESMAGVQLAVDGDWEEAGGVVGEVLVGGPQVVYLHTLARAHPSRRHMHAYIPASFVLPHAISIHASNAEHSLHTPKPHA